MKYPTDIQTGDLFSQPFGTNPKMMVRSSDPDTSRQAAASVDSTHLEMLVYEVIAKHPNGCTSDEIMAHFPDRGVQTISPRYAPLIRKGFIEDSGERRKGNLGKSQRVLKAIKHVNHSTGE
jgi:hypothetical protein